MMIQSSYLYNSISYIGEVATLARWQLYTEMPPGDHR